MATILHQSSLRAPPPEIRPTSRLEPERAQKLQRVAQPVGDAFEHRPDERAAIVAHGQADERAARVGVGMGRALAGQVRLEEEPLAPGGQRSASASELSA